MMACEQCPWREKNQGKDHPHGFYTRANLRRLWNQIRRGGGAQSCHLTDPSHPDHVRAGAKPGAQAKECPGSVILVLRELSHASDEGCLTPESATRYLATRPRGLTKPGLLYWATRLPPLCGTLLGGPRLPEVNVEDPEIVHPEQALR